MSRPMSSATASGSPFGVAFDIDGVLWRAPAIIPGADTALQRLPDRFWFAGRVQRGVKWVYPSPVTHDPERYFTAGARLAWYEFKSTSTDVRMMSNDVFCGHAAGPRTIFTIDAVRGTDWFTRVRADAGDARYRS